MTKLKNKSIRDELLPQIQTAWADPILKDLVKHGARIYLCAGAVRDTIARQELGLNNPIRDFDIGVASVSKVYFHGLMVECAGEKNRYGGYRFNVTNFPTWDVWRLEDTIGLKKTRSHFSLDNVLRSFVLDCNAVALDILRGDLWDCGVFSCLRRREIDLVRNALIHSRSTFAAKAVLLHFCYQFTLTSKLKRFVSRYLDRPALMHECSKVRRGSLGKDECFRLTSPLD